MYLVTCEAISGAMQAIEQISTLNPLRKSSSYQFEGVTSIEIHMELNLKNLAKQNLL